MEKVAKQNKIEKILEKKSTTWRTRTKKTKHILKIILFSLRVFFASPKNTHNFIRVHFKRKTKNHFNQRIYFLTFFALVFAYCSYCSSSILSGS